MLKYMAFLSNRDPSSISINMTNWGYILIHSVCPARDSIALGSILLTTLMFEKNFIVRDENITQLMNNILIAGKLFYIK